MAAVHRACLVGGDTRGVSAEYLDHPRPLAFAHRGGAARQPENSLLAFENAARLGYAYLETDARSTADGKLIAFHDADLNRATDRTGQVRRLPWREVSAARVNGTASIPLLEDVLGTFPELRFNIDLKDAGTIEPLAGVLKRTLAWDRVCISSFSGRRLLAGQRSLDRPVCLAVTPAIDCRYLCARCTLRRSGDRSEIGLSWSFGYLQWHEVTKCQAESSLRSPSSQ